jgi:site-specific recombinase XerD
MSFDVGSKICIKDKAQKNYNLSPNFEDPDVYKTYPDYLRHVIASAKRFSFYGKFNEVPMRDITYYDADSFHRYVAREHGKIQANRQATHLRMIFNFGIRKGYADINPFSRITHFSEKERLKNVPFST